MEETSNGVSRRTVLRTTSGSALLALGATSVAAGDSVGASDDSPSVATREATRVQDISATLNGELLDLGGSATVDVYFEYWIPDDEDITYCPRGDHEVHTTEPKTLSGPGEFSERVGKLCENTWYGFRAVAEADGTTVTGDVKSFFTITI